MSLMGVTPFLIVVVMCTLSLTVAESIVKIVAPQKTFAELKKKSLRCYQRSEILPYEYAPGCSGVIDVDGVKTPVRINGVGLRGKEIGAKKRPRVLVIGDSFVFGYGVEEQERIGDVIEKELGNVEVISAGFVGDAGPDTSYSYVVHEGLALEPDLMIVALFPYNDLSDLTKTAWVIGENGDLRSVSMPEKWIDSEGFLRRKDMPWRYRLPFVRDSHVTQFLIGWLDRATRIVRRKIEIRTGWARGSALAHDEFRRCLFERQCSGQWDQAAEKARTILKRFKGIAENKSIPLSVVMVPLQSQVVGQDPSWTVFHQIVSDEQIAFLDLQVGLRDSGLHPSELYVPDGHWTAQGHRVAGEITSRWILKQRLLSR